MDDLFAKESETSDKGADNYECAFCQKMYIDNTELITDWARETVWCWGKQGVWGGQGKRLWSLLPGNLKQQQRSFEAHGGAISCQGKRLCLVPLFFLKAKVKEH